MLPCSCSVTRRSWDCRGRRRWQVSTYVYHRYMASPMPAIPLRLDSVVKRFGDLTAVSGVSLEVRERACLGLLGPNGAGKSTLIRSIAGRVRLDSGSIRVFGEPAGSPKTDRNSTRLNSRHLLISHADFCLKNNR